MKRALASRKMVKLPIHLLGVGQQAMDRWRRRERASGRKGKTDRHERKNEELAEGENNRTRTRIAELERI